MIGTGCWTLAGGRVRMSLVKELMAMVMTAVAVAEAGALGRGWCVVGAGCWVLAAGRWLVLELLASGGGGGGAGSWMLRCGWWVLAAG